MKLITILFIALCGVICAAETPAEKLNVLFIEIDDLNDWVGVFGGHPQAKTPNMDRLCLLYPCAAVDE